VAQILTSKLVVAMTNLLLTGAGFSYNWGGPLASDVFSNLLSDNHVDDHTRRLLLEADGKALLGFV
jgi:hypothetical protein